jgi:hypothetical protein
VFLRRSCRRGKVGEWPTTKAKLANSSLPVDWHHHFLALLAFALTHDNRLTQAANVMASIVAERILSSLEAANFVVMWRPGRGDLP